MSEKQFKIYQDSIRKFESNRIWGVKSETNSLEPYMTFKEAEKCCDLLNNLNDECNFLAKQRNYLKSKLNEQQATITEYEDFCYNLCMFIIGKDLDDEYKEKYGKEYKIITKWKGCGSDE